VHQDPVEAWRELVGRASPAFQRASARVADGPWRPFRLQLAWMLMLLAARAPANRMLIAKVERASIAPLATQLENAERCRAAGLGLGDGGDADGREEEDGPAHGSSGGEREGEGLAAKGGAWGGDGGGGAGGGGGAAPPAWIDCPPSAGSADPNGVPPPPSFGPGGPHAAPLPAAANVHPAPAAVAGAGPAARGGVGLDEVGGVWAGAFVLAGDGDDEDLEMLQQEVAFFSSQASVQRRSEPGAGAGAAAR
jgi:hypothetical protein